MGQSAGKPPSAPDPATILALQNQYNRSNTSGPFGSQSWSSSGPGGHETLTTNLSPQMQGAVDRAFSAAATPYQREYIPQGADQLTSAILGRVGGRYGLSGQSFDTNLQHQKGAQQSPNPPQGLGQGMSGMGIQTQGSPMQTQLGLQQQGAGMGGMAGLMGGSPMSGGIPQGSFGAMQGSGGFNNMMGGMPITGSDHNIFSAMQALPGMRGGPSLGMPQVNTQQPSPNAMPGRMTY